MNKNRGATARLGVLSACPGYPLCTINAVGKRNL